jgi:hypothetical protein
MVLLGLRRDEFNQVCRAGRRHFLCGSRSRMGTGHLLQLFPRSLVGVKLQGLAWVNLLPEEAALGIPAEHGDIDPNRFIVVIEDDHPTLYDGRLAHIAPLKSLLE